MSMSLLPLLMAAALSPQSAIDIRCVAVLGVVAYRQEREGGWTDVPPVTADGERFAGIVGERVMGETNQTKEAVRDMILAQVAAIQQQKALPRGDVDACIARIAVVAPALQPADLPRCAGRMALAAERVKAREGLTAGAKDLAVVASVLAYRARTEGVAKGLSEAQVADAIAAARQVAEVDPSDDSVELARCAELAAAQ